MSARFSTLLFLSCFLSSTALAFSSGYAKHGLFNRAADGCSSYCTTESDIEGLNVLVPNCLEAGNNVEFCVCEVWTYLEGSCRGCLLDAFGYVELALLETCGVPNSLPIYSNCAVQCLSDSDQDAIAATLQICYYDDWACECRTTAQLSSECFSCWIKQTPFNASQYSTMCAAFTGSSTPTPTISFSVPSPSASVTSLDPDAESYPGRVSTPSVSGTTTTASSSSGGGATSPKSTPTGAAARGAELAWHTVCPIVLTFFLSLAAFVFL